MSNALIYSTYHYLPGRHSKQTVKGDRELWLSQRVWDQLDHNVLYCTVCDKSLLAIHLMILIEMNLQSKYVWRVIESGRNICNVTFNVLLYYTRESITGLVEVGEKLVICLLHSVYAPITCTDPL